MKKFCLLISMLVSTVFVFSQNDVPFQSTMISIGNSQNVKIETYNSTYCYLQNQENKLTIIGYEYGGYPKYKMPSKFCEKYARWTPGELIARSGKLKNTALTVGVVTCLSASALIGFSFLTGDPVQMCAIGGVVGFGGGIATIAILATSNKLLQEAGLKMQRIQLSANGLNIKF